MIIEKIRKAMRQAEGIRNEYLMKEDYAFAGNQQAYIDGLETAVTFLEIDQTDTRLIDNYIKMYIDHISSEKNRDNWFRVAEYQQKLKAFRQVKVWLSEAAEKEQPQ